MSEQFVSVKVIEVTGQSALVQFDVNGIAYRSRVDAADVVDGMCDAERLRDAPHGIIWRLEFPDLARDVEIALKRRGIWTYADLQQNDRAIVRIATDLLGAAIWDAAKKGCKGTTIVP